MRLLQPTAEPTCAVPFSALASLPAPVRAAIEGEALRVNSRYLYEFIEEYAFCPFAKSGREAGQTSRYVYYADSTDLAPLLALMQQVADDPQQVVAQVIFPLLEVQADRWLQFCQELTALGHAQRGGAPVLAFAALHPQLRYGTENPFAMVPLFRRAPDPTLQWARLEGLAQLYEGRDTQTRVVDSAEVFDFVRNAPRPRPALYHRVTETNAKMAQMLQIPLIEAQLRDMTEDAQRSYARILMELLRSPSD